MACAQRPVLQRGQDEDRPPRRRIRLSGIHRPPLSGQADHQPRQGGYPPGHTRLGRENRALRRADGGVVLGTVHPITRGWANYYRGVASSRVFAALDTYLWRLTYKW